jgi:hypothetical protein
VCGDQRYRRFTAEIDVSLVDDDRTVGQGARQSVDVGQRDQTTGRRIRIRENHGPGLARHEVVDAIANRLSSGTHSCSMPYNRQ